MAPPIYPLDLKKQGSVYLVRPLLAHYIADELSLALRSRRVLDWIEAGTLKLRIGASYALADAAQAHRDLESRATTGKLLLDINS
jgi:NADPH2:quinone reductase